MAEEQAIPEETLSIAQRLIHELRGWGSDWVSDYDHESDRNVVARALLAAELRGRQQQKEADAMHTLRFSDESKCPDALYEIGDARRIWVNEGDLVHMQMAGTAIRQ